MEPTTTAALIGAGSSLLGGMMGSETSYKTFMYDQLRQQKKYATRGIQWKVRDAKAAGIHPLYALGASTPSFNPVSIPSGGGFDPMSEAIGNAGQDISRAVYAHMTKQERAAASELTRINIEKERTGLDIMRTDLASAQHRLNQQLNPAPPPTTTVPNPVIPGRVDKPSQEPGVHTSSSIVKLDDGSVLKVPSQPAKERTEDNIFATGLYNIYEFGRPLFGFGTSPPPSKKDLPPGAKGWIPADRSGVRWAPDYGFGYTGRPKHWTAPYKESWNWLKKKFKKYKNTSDRYNYRDRK